MEFLSEALFNLRDIEADDRLVGDSLLNSHLNLCFSWVRGLNCFVDLKSFQFIVALKLDLAPISLQNAFTSHFVNRLPTVLREQILSLGGCCLSVN